MILILFQKQFISSFQIDVDRTYECLMAIMQTGLFINLFLFKPTIIMNPFEAADITQDETIFNFDN
jgi:hypothetical protein